MGFTDYIRNSVSAGSKPVDEPSFGPDYWAKWHWNSEAAALDFPSVAELTVLDELFKKITDISSKDERKRGHRDSFIVPPGQDFLPFNKGYRKSATLSRSSSVSSSSLSSSSSVLQQQVTLLNERSEQLGTLCLLLGEHIDKVAQNATYWSWSVDCFDKLVRVYSLLYSSSAGDPQVKPYMITTICSLAAIMATSLAKNSHGAAPPPLSKYEHQRTNRFMTSRVLPCLLWLVGNEGTDHHMSGECVSYVLSCVQFSASALRAFLHESKRDKLFQFPRRRHLRLWRSMWLKVILERLVANKAEDKSAATLRTIVVEEIVTSFGAEQDSYVRDHYEILFNTPLESVDTFYCTASPEQARVFLAGLSDVPRNLLDLQRSLLKV
ncbi:hypothetical protein D0Z00_002531 [Geotrichum galactomycetum]|uniref:Uncharacterized protein n=1 Tax=Geotrichum galactomycetum TaxID=27317 RepID=A0ACB6V3S9_9ASCO|nr:hypothetical protein D0Z00_002531 [Geotrichum candidum]